MLGTKFFDKLFSRGIQVGTIVTKRENVGRTSTNGTRVPSFTYDVRNIDHGTDNDERPTDGWDRGKIGFKTPI